MVAEVEVGKEVHQEAGEVMEVLDIKVELGKKDWQ